MDIQGFLGIDKPAGCTSHDVVSQIRRRFGIKKVGHTGTLDPMATGVLLLALGAFTRLSAYLSNLDKRYLATIHLGVETNTFDAEGDIVRTREQIPADPALFAAVLEEFTGEIDQVPPMFSALKKDGKRLYKMAREGQIIEREPRRIAIYSIEVCSFDSPLLQLDIHCSKGTYVRSLAADFGTRLGCGAHLAALRRTSVGGIDLAQCTALETLAALPDASGLAPFLIDPQCALGHLEALSLDAGEERRFQNGNAITGLNTDRLTDATVRVVGRQKGLLGIGLVRTDGTLQPVRVISRREN